MNSVSFGRDSGEGTLTSFDIQSIVERKDLRGNTGKDREEVQKMKISWKRQLHVGMGICCSSKAFFFF